MMTWNDFFDFSDDQPINEAISSIDGLARSYQKMISSVEDSNQRLAGDLVAVQTNAEELLKTVSGLNMSFEKNQKILSESSSASENLVKEYQALKDVESANVKTIQTMNDELKKLNETKDKASKITQEEAGSVNDLRIRLAEAEKAYKAMGASTDQAIKEEQLEKVRGLAAEYKQVNTVLADAKKGAQNAAGSYNELSNRVADAKKKLKEMEGGLSGNSKEFKELQKFAKEGTQQLKDWDETVGDSKRKVGDYAGEISKIAPGFGGLIGNIEGATASAKKFIATPLGAIIAAIAAALASLTAFFKGSIEGQDSLNKVMKVGEAIFETLKDVLEVVGKALFDAISEPKKTWEEFVGFISEIGDKIKAAFENPIDTLKAFGQAIVDNIIVRVKGLGNIFTSLWEIISSGFTDGWKDLGDAVIQATVGVEDGIDKIVDAMQPLADELQRRIDLGLKISELENKLRKDRIADILDDAKTELQVNKLLVEAKDKLRFTEEERFAKLRKANELLEDQLEGDLQLIRDEIKLQQLVIQQSGETYESRQKLVELQAQEIALQSKFFQEKKRRQAQEIALIREIEQEEIQANKRIADAEAALNSFRLNDTIRTNNKILAEENSSLEERLQAIMENESAQQQLLQQERDAQLKAAKESALARIELSSDTIDQIYNQENLSINQRIQLEREAKEALLGTDEAFADQALKIQEDFAAKSDEITEQSAKAAENNVFKVMHRDAEILSAQINTALNEDLKNLNEAFAAGDAGSIEDFEKQKLAIQKQAQEESLNSQLNFLKERVELLKEGSAERIKVEEQISKVELALSERSAKDRLEVEKKLQDAVRNLKDAAIQSALTIIDNLNQAETAKRQEQLSNLEEQTNKELELIDFRLSQQLAMEGLTEEQRLIMTAEAEEQKSIIRNDAAAKQAEIEAKQKEADKKRAIFEKALGITEVGINTAIAVSKALASAPPPANFILAALVGAAGAVQIAAIASKQIPAFAEGVERSPEGLAIVNEEGRELIVSPTGKARIIDSKGPTLTYLERGSKVLTADETAKMMENEVFAHEKNLLGKGVQTVIEVSHKENNRELINTMNRRMLSLEATIKSKKELHMNVTRSGLEMWLRDSAWRTKWLNEHYS